MESLLLRVTMRLHWFKGRFLATKETEHSSQSPVAAATLQKNIVVATHIT
jgi:hypothetical protein